jgi:hypothetical protein
MKHAKPSLLLALVALLLVACAPATKMVSNKAGNWQSQPKRLFVVTDVGSDFGDEYYKSFEEKTTSILRDCGVTAGFSRITELELDRDIHVNRVKAFGADTVLTVRRNGGTRSQNALFHVIYDVVLMDAPSGKIGWRARTDFYRGGTAVFTPAERGASLAIDITNKMKDDGLLGTCAPIKA